MRFKHFSQLDSMDCGPACLKMIAKHYGQNFSISYLREICYIDKAGVSLMGICEASERIGLDPLAVKVRLQSTEEDPGLSDVPLPAIIHWNQNHFVVLVKLSRKFAWIADPASTLRKVPIKEFRKSWVSDDDQGVALILKVTSKFRNRDNVEEEKSGFSFLYSFLTPYRKLFFQLILGLLVGTIFQLIFPFLTQSLVDIGIDSKNLNFIYLILVGQLMLFVGSVTVQFIQSWILLHISIRISVSLVSEFLIKLMNLPLKFFDSRNTGDLLQRISDHKRIEVFLTNTLLSVLLSTTSIMVFGIVLCIYSLPIFLIFLVSSILYILWVAFFLSYRRDVDNKLFQELGENQESLIEIIQGMTEIKLQGSQLKRRWKWANIQAKLFNTQIKSLKITQIQDAGAFSISQVKDILITFLAATEVLNGHMTLGMMLAVQYIIGQLNSPLQQLVGFMRSAQDAKLSLERLAEIHSSENEEDNTRQKTTDFNHDDIHIENLSFRYTSLGKEVLKNVNFSIPKGKMTALVGVSGSGKTTLIKLLLGFYQPTDGVIKVGRHNLSDLNLKKWREECGVVMQDGFVFSDTIGNNIAESEDSINLGKVHRAADCAHINEFVNSLPLGFNTMIGAKGNGLSQGQKQRLFIARAVFKDPQYLFFDEATNALDANTEKAVMNNLNNFLKDRTSVVVAHRLSTVKNADQILVLDNGEIIESGTHEDLVSSKGYYFELVKNQLELGN